MAGETSQTVDFAFDPAFGSSFHDPARFASYGVTPTLTWNLQGDWQLRAMANYGRSTNETREYLLNSGAIGAGLGGTTVQTALNPYNITATNPAVLTAIRDNSNLSDAWQEMRELRAVADGTLLTLPGGNIKLAVGSEYHFENVSPYLLSGPSTSATTVRDYASRNIKSAYGEVFVPIFGKDNALPGVQALDALGVRPLRQIHGRGQHEPTRNWVSTTARSRTCSFAAPGESRSMRRASRTRATQWIRGCHAHPRKSVPRRGQPVHP